MQPPFSGRNQSGRNIGRKIGEKHGKDRFGNDLQKQFLKDGRRSMNLESLKKVFGLNQSKLCFGRKAQTNLDHGTSGGGKLAGHQWSLDASRLYDMSLADSKLCECCQPEGTEKYNLYQCSGWMEEGNQMPDVVRCCEMKAKSSDEDRKWQRQLASYPKFDNP